MSIDPTPFLYTSLGPNALGSSGMSFEGPVQLLNTMAGYGLVAGVACLLSGYVLRALFTKSGEYRSQRAARA